MEDPNDKRNNEIVKMPESMIEAQKMLEIVEKLQSNLSISSSDGAMSGNMDNGFSYNARSGSDFPEGPEGPEGSETPEQ